MKQLNLRTIVVKKYRPQRSKKPIISKENLLNQDFSTKMICEKWAANTQPEKWNNGLKPTK